ncbi:ABC transporter substrate-binding protein [Desulfuribacillus alkaliarsenatis]|nr:iron-siderophore ABC transporter substrate-binding protein [Desulfuribacillus alkaliarsenatis]
MKKIWLFSIVALLLVLTACGGSATQSSSDQGNQNGVGRENEGNNEAVEPGTRIIEHAMGTTEVPANPHRIVVMNGDALEALLAVGITPVGATQAMGDRIWYPHLEEYMDGVTNVGTMSEPDLEAVMQLEPDLILGTKTRTESSYDLLSMIAPTIFNEAHTDGEWKNDFLLYVESVGKLEEGKKILEDWEARAANLSIRLGAADKLNEEVGVLRFTAGQGRFFYNNSYSGSILKELNFARPANHDSYDAWTENITQERIPEMDADILFYFVLDSGDGEGLKFADEWMSHQLFQGLRAAQKGQVYEVDDAYWNMTYGIISADYVLDDIERMLLGE